MAQLTNLCSVLESYSIKLKFKTMGYPRYHDQSYSSDTFKQLYASGSLNFHLYKLCSITGNITKKCGWTQIIAKSDISAKP